MPKRIVKKQLMRLIEMQWPKFGFGNTRQRLMARLYYRQYIKEHGKRGKSQKWEVYL